MEIQSLDLILEARMSEELKKSVAKELENKEDKSIASLLSSNNDVSPSNENDFNSENRFSSESD